MNNFSGKEKRVTCRLIVFCPFSQAKREADSGGAESVVFAIEGPAFSQYDFTPPDPDPDPDAAAAAAAGRGVVPPPPPLRLRVGGYPLFVASFADELSTEGHEVKTASSVWSCAVVLVKYLEYATAQASASRGPPLTGTSRVLELGAGTGLVGVAAARLIAAGGACRGAGACAGEVIITDVATVVPGLAKTISLNRAAEHQSSTARDASAADSIGSEGGSVDRRSLPARAAALDWTRAETDLAAIQPGAHPLFDVIL